MNDMSQPPEPVLAPMPTSLAWLLAVGGGLIVANIYYAQPLAGPISAALGLAPGAAGLIVTVTQLGYVLGLLLLVPLADLVENRRLIVACSCVPALALLAAALSTHPLPFLLARCASASASVAVQVLVPYAAHMAPEATRGRVVGNIIGGLMLGIMLARPVSSFLAQVRRGTPCSSLSAASMLLLALVLAAALPRAPAGAGLRYGALLVSMGHLARTTPVLQRRALYHACLFGAFSLFWTAVPLLLAGPDFRLSQGGIALFALAGVAGAVSAPIAGRVADRGLTRPATGLRDARSPASPSLMTHLVPADGSRAWRWACWSPRPSCWTSA